MQRLPWTAEIIMKTKPILCAWLLIPERLDSAAAEKNGDFSAAAED